MRLENRLMLPFGVFLASILILSIFFVNFVEVTKDNYENIVNSDTRFDALVNILVHYDMVREFSLSAFRLTGDKKYAEQYSEYVLKSDQMYQDIIKHLDNQEMKSQYQSRYDKFKELSSIENKALVGLTGMDVLESEAYLQLKSDFSESMDMPKEFYAVKVKDKMVRNIKQAKISEYMLLFALLLTVVLLVIEFIFIKIEVVNPMKKIGKLIEEKENFGDMSVLADRVIQNKDKTVKEITEMKNMLKLATVIMKSRESEDGRNKGKKK